ncbi:virulence factor [Oceanobacillus piezotolerans]|uniref:Virulence factor n=1 Tax=Oceanobacillus piezotolerans TaxID=2448030 RepID=A0A498D7U3_9BACI|nr:conserved virulence factor C family protein [Oceanobacillus piezotolerans]RLL42027.1 virulence factor [Oceanobacillus piezotolerans]
MRITSIEPTPSPHSMKINVDEELAAGENYNYKQGENLNKAPSYVKELFQIHGVINIYRVVDFIALARNPKVPWESILPKVREVLGTEETEDHLSHTQPIVTSHDAFGEVKVYIQMYRDIPIQVKLDDGNEEKRFGLPNYFMNAAMEASSHSPDFIMERKWVEQRPRYGSMEDIGKEIVEEIMASYDEKRIDRLVINANQTEDTKQNVIPPTEQSPSPGVMNDPNWKVRYAALDRLDPTLEHLPLLERAINDEKASIRRLATAYLGMIEEPDVLPLLYKALKDKAVNVRRTAGDCISDLGYKEAMPEMILSLKDSSRLVRWRAAMFLYEVGDESCIPALEEAADDPEFEVRMQIKLALERIKGGEDAKGSVWHQMTLATQDNKK